MRNSWSKGGSEANNHCTKISTCGTKSKTENKPIGREDWLSHNTTVQTWNDVATNIF